MVELAIAIPLGIFATNPSFDRPENRLKFMGRDRDGGYWFFPQCFEDREQSSVLLTPNYDSFDQISKTHCGSTSGNWVAGHISSVRNMKQMTSLQGSKKEWRSFFSWENGHFLLSSSYSFQISPIFIYLKLTKFTWKVFFYIIDTLFVFKTSTHPPGTMTLRQTFTCKVESNSSFMLFQTPGLFSHIALVFFLHRKFWNFWRTCMVL